MVTTDSRASLLEASPSEWKFDFWKELYERTKDLPSKIGLLGATPELWSGADEVIVYLMDVADAETATDPRTQALAGKALQMLHRSIERNRGFHSDSIQHTSLAVVEKALWFSRPATNFKSLVNHLNGTSEEERYVRRYLRNL